MGWGFRPRLRSGPSGGAISLGMKSALHHPLPAMAVSLGLVVTAVVLLHRAPGWLDGGPAAFLVEPVGGDVLRRGFRLLNDASFLWIFLPFFGFELLRYFLKQRLGRDLLGDMAANALTFGGFLVFEYGMYFLFAAGLYEAVWSRASLPRLPVNPLSIAGAVLLADLLYYWEHRFTHHTALGWATHTVHHSSPHFNLSVAYRFGPFDGFFPLFFSSLPLVALGFPPVLALQAEIFVQTFQTILHTEAIGRLPRPLEFVFNTPSHHRVHHGANERYCDRNYGGILILWDRLFGTFEPEVEPVRYGLRHPIRTNHPGIVFFHGLQRLGRQLRATPGTAARLRLLVSPPA